MVKIEQPKWNVPAGESRAGWIKSIEESDGQWGKSLKWEIVGEDGTEYRAFSPFAIEKLTMEWVRALVGEVPTADFDTDVLIGMPVRATWAPKASGEGSKITILARRQAEFKDFS